MKLDDLYPAVITLILIGIVLGIGIFILSSIEDNVDSTTSVTVSSESVFINETGDTLAGASARDFAAATLTGLWNATKTYEVGNATLSAAGVLTNATALVFEDAGVKVNYTYTYSADTEASTSVNQTIAGMATFADWIAIIVVVIAAAIVLGIVLSSFGRRQPSV